jgi:IclR family KDG regulon transcriptional repressor
MWQSSEHMGTENHIHSTGQDAMMQSKRDHNTIQSVERAMQILFSFTMEHPRWRTSELSSALDLHPSTVSRLLSTMRKMGALKKDPVTDEYELNARILSLAQTVVSQLDLVKIAYPLMTELTGSFNESSFLVIPDGDHTLTVAQVTAARLIGPSTWHVGMRYQLNATTGGKLILAYGPRSRLDELIKRGLIQYTKHTVTSPAKLIEQLEQVHRQGYVIQNQELEVGLFAIGAPIRDHQGHVVAGLSMSGPPERLGGENLPDYIGGVRDTADRISKTLGWPGVNVFPPEHEADLQGIGSAVDPSHAQAGG